jgi:uncharacterized protein
MTKISDLLLETNPWWKEPYTADYKNRHIYESISKHLPLPHIIALIGLRRVGKTTLLQKIAQDYLHKGGNPQHIMYFSFDEHPDIALRDPIKKYESLTGVSIQSGTFLFLLDEIQKLADWENQLKTFYDAYGKRIKIAISGSESLFIQRKSKATLAGRLFEFTVRPLSFKEFLLFKGQQNLTLPLHEKELSALFSEFITTFGFPELVGVREKETIFKYIRESILDKVVYRDMLTLFPIKDPVALTSLLRILTEDPGQLIDLNDLAGQLGITRQTLSRYLSYLEDSFLMRKLYNFSKNKRKSERKLKKYYPTVLDPALAFKNDDLSKSRTFEWLMVNQLNASFFWRDSRKNKVDIVLINDQITPVEVKHGKITTDGLIAFMNEFGIRTAYILSPDKSETRRIKGKTIHIVPAYQYLLQSTPPD